MLLSRGEIPIATVHCQLSVKGGIIGRGLGDLVGYDAPIAVPSANLFDFFSSHPPMPQLGIASERAGRSAPFNA